MKKLLLSALMATPLFALAVTTYTGPANITNASWNNPANWSAGVPTPNEEVRFATHVIIAETLPMTTGNAVAILGTGSLTINSGVTAAFDNLRVNGTGALINNGNATFNNVTYSSVSPVAPDASITNNGTMHLRNLNVGQGNANDGSFTNSGTLTVLMDVVVEEGVLTNTGSISSQGLDVRPGATVENYGSYTSEGPYSSTKIVVNEGGAAIGTGTLNNYCGGTINSIITGNPATGAGGDIYAIDIAGTFNNQGAVNIGNPPPAAPNPNSKGMIIRNSGHFASTGPCTSYMFNIDPGNCVIQDNTGANGSFVMEPTSGSIVSGSNCDNLFVLPIKLVSFTGAAVNGQASLNWVSSVEINAYSYEVEQSANGINFTKVATVAAKGIASSYAINVNQPFELGYYRLKMIDKDGSFEYSAVVLVKMAKAVKALSLSVNPTVVASGSNYTMVINAATYRGVANIQIYNAAGAMVTNQRAIINSEITLVNANAGKLAKGSYFVKMIAGNNRVETTNLIIQ